MAPTLDRDASTSTRNGLGSRRGWVLKLHFLECGHGLSNFRVLGEGFGFTFHKGGNKGSVILDDPFLEVCKDQKTLELFNIGWNRPGLNGFPLPLLHSNTVLTDVIS